MIDDKLLEISENGEGGYHRLSRYGSWLVAVLNQNENYDSIKKVEYLEYHAETDEVFILLKGNASLIISGGKDKPQDIEIIDMKKLKFYNVKKGVWHSIVLKNEGSVAIVENSDTSKDNSAYYYLNYNEKEELVKLNESVEYND